jgi:hypothetical protein
METDTPEERRTHLQRGGSLELSRSTLFQKNEAINGLSTAGRLKDKLSTEQTNQHDTGSCYSNDSYGLGNKFHALAEPDGSSPCSLDPPPQKKKPTSHLHILFLSDIFLHPKRPRQL